MQDEAVGDVHVSVEQFRDHLETTVKALHDSTTQLSQSFTSVTSVYLLTYFNRIRQVAPMCPHENPLIKPATVERICTVPE